MHYSAWLCPHLQNVRKCSPECLQGFPDYFTFVGLGGKTQTSWVRNPSLTQRYQQLGNAVSPMVADALGRCLATAAVGAAPVGAFVIPAPNPEFQRVSAPSISRVLR